MGVSVSNGVWYAQHAGQRVCYSEARFGSVAQDLATKAFERMTLGKFNDAQEDLIFKNSWRLQDAARFLLISDNQLRQWLITGLINGREVPPPRRDSKGGCDKFNGFEVVSAAARLGLKKQIEKIFNVPMKG
ncbi:hypothetical protein [Aeromonas dhakensis]|uniref:hypothetical protein n=1 Tax=Aeromonas dhakensis TaxID=196024 RepID=UPI002B459F34|nr:hypothetical protein [Aeromonas dhakensis]